MDNEKEEQMTKEEFEMLKRFILSDIEKILSAESLKEAKTIACDLKVKVAGE